MWDWFNIKLIFFFLDWATVWGPLDWALKWHGQAGPEGLIKAGSGINKPASNPICYHSYSKGFEVSNDNALTRLMNLG